MRMIVCHAGSASNPEHRDGPDFACLRGLDVLAAGRGALEAVVVATESLEDDERFNAGTGSNLRLDGETVQMDAACMTGSGGFGAVAAIERVAHPVRAARYVIDTRHVLLAGRGATAFARRRGLPDHDPITPGARDRYEQLLRSHPELGVGDWSAEALEESWNFDTSYRATFGCDTVGAVAWDGCLFAAALSSGGTEAALLGRVGDVPMPGCGLYAGRHGAVAVTGDGEALVRSMLAHRAYVRLEQKQDLKAIAGWALDSLPPEVDVGIILIDQTRFFGAARHGMAWAGISEPSEQPPWRS